MKPSNIMDARSWKFWAFWGLVFAVITFIGISAINPISLIPKDQTVAEESESAGTSGRLVSASSRIEKGVTLYNSDGSAFGTVTNFSERHQFPNGTDRGVEVDGFWYLRSFVINSKYIKD